ncbi:MAG: NAD(P)-dependent oxidoreductase [Actinomycetota bacterium]
MILLLESAHAEAEALLADTADLVRSSDALAVAPEVRAAVRAVVTRGKGQVSAPVIEALPALEVVARCGVGLDNIDTVAADAAGVTVVHAPGSTTVAVAEHALLLTLALGRRLTTLDREVSAGNWSVRDGYEGFELRGKTLGVIGLGDIGRRIALLGRAFDMEVVCATRRAPTVDVPRRELSELLATADVVQVCVPLTDETRGLIDDDAFAALKPGALVVNTARGPIVDHAALRRALSGAADGGGGIGGYAADVWDPEPPRLDDPLLGDERVLITPHLAALTDVTYRELCLRPARSVVAVLTGQAPDPATVYKVGGK